MDADDPGVEVQEVVETSDDVVEALARLLPQLSSSAPAPTPAEVDEMVSSPAIALFVAREPSGRIVGSLTLAFFRIPTAVRAWIEDVVVDSEARGKGVGELLTKAAVARAHEVGAKTVELTSRPSREAANRLYVRLGFEPRKTNVYRYSLDA